jgi:filamentous hemagglutinin family protein
MQNISNSLFILIIFSSSLFAQISTDGTLGPQMPLLGPDYQIGAELGQQHGGNLFHSFQYFNLRHPEKATFAGPNNVQNIISRVTGGNRSDIDGLIRSTIPNTNMYFLNPYGIFFGPNAQLDVQGSFHASTADYLRLEDGGYFAARYPSDSVLTVAPVKAFGFLTEYPESIKITDSFLRVPQQQTLSMIGGDIFIQDGTLFASSGQINLVSIASEREMVFKNSDFSIHAPKLGNIEIQQSSTKAYQEKFENTPFYDFPPANIDVSGLDISGLDAGGQIFIRAGNVILNKGEIFADTYEGKGLGIDIVVDGDLYLIDDAKITADNYSYKQGGNISITAQKLRLSQQNLESENANSKISTDTFNFGNAGKIEINSSILEINSGLIAAVTKNRGNTGGDIIINANQITLQNRGFINVATGTVGNAGNITINARERLSVMESSSISAGTHRCSGYS